ncbi:MAG TPA: bifunctional enoyl-CoA hydratase/phosphate acetyltransferase [bacterium]|nr:bifunctional enoyl-CoA hydratase/phosphate acetyltransferase [bacterium]
MLTSFETVLKLARTRGRLRFAVAGAASESVVCAVLDAQHFGILDPILIGPADEIRRIADGMGVDLSAIPVLDEREENSIARKSAALIHEGAADALMKGLLSTPVLLRAVLDRAFNLRTDRLLSHVALMEIPAYHKLILVTDSGMISRPDLSQKREILRNAVDVMRRLGVEKPKIALLAANEKVSDKLPETGDAVGLVRWAEGGGLGDAVVEGPMAVDIAFDPEAARIKHFKSRVSGDPDILLIPDVSAGNIFAKGLVYLAHAKIAGVIVGARMPIVLISRAESAESMLRSVALANIVS